MDVITLVRTLWDRFAATLAIVLGLVALLLGYLGVKDTAYVAEQIPYIISGGLIGIFLLGVGATLWLSADLKDQWRALLDVRDALEDGELRLVHTSELTALVQTSTSNGDHPADDSPTSRSRPRRQPAANRR
jgi:hypothetical protein